MRPIRLTIEAFGPYVARQVLDFQELGGHEFFLIHGPTGSGKTTLLDAICYALYGETSGNGRNGVQMCCQQATPEAETVVRFDFRIGSAHYRAERRPEQDVAKKRGTGTTRRPGEAVLWRATIMDCDPGIGDDGWTPLATKANQVNALVTQMLGFSSEQFRQVILIPQGRFREVLESDSKKREEILETLFGTERFSALQNSLKTKARALEDRARTGEEQKKALLQAQQVETTEALSEKHSSAQQAIREIEEQLPPLQNRHDAAVKALGNARQLETLFQESEAANKAHTNLVLLDPKIKSARQSIALAQKASALRPEHELWQQARQHAESSGREINNLRSTLPQLQTAVDEAVKNHATAEGKIPRIKALEAEASRLQCLQPKLAEWIQILAAVEISNKTFLQISTEAKRLQNEAVDLANEIPKTERRWSEVIDARSRIPQLEIDLKNATDTLSLLRQRVILTTDLNSKEKLLEIRKASNKKLAQQHRLLRQLLSEEQTRWNNSQAELLASQLSDGNPCAVCGSVQHPSPAHTGDTTALPSHAKLESAREDFAKVEMKLEEARDAFQNFDNEVVGLRAKRDALPEISTDAAELQERIEKLTSDIERFRKLAASTTETELAELRKKSEQAQVVKVAAETQRTNAETHHQRDLAARDLLARDIPEDLRTPDAIKHKIASLQREIQQAEQARKQAETTRQEKANTLRDAHAKIETLTEAAQAAEVAMLERHRAWLVALQSAAFTDETMWLAARLEPAASEKLSREIDQFTREIAASLDRLSRARDALAKTGATERPDIETLNQHARLAGEMLHTLRDQRTRLARDLETLEDALARLAKMEHSFGELQAAYSVAGRLAEVVNGKNPLNLTLQRFVLTAFLDDTLIAATARLVRMSRGRFHLERRRELTDLRRSSGLDLDVFDEFTGQSRNVNTLSGGEAFLASLSLALGLADVVQSYSGGLRMEALFIDEGFGTLDPEALEEALKVLMDLRENGRLVGIISHVPELKERIDVRLEVTATRQGSEARFVTL